MSKAIRSLLFVVVALSLLLVACGSNSTPAVAPAGESTDTATPASNWCGSMEWNVPIEKCVEDKIAIIPVGDKKVLALVQLSPNPVNVDGSATLTFDIQVQNELGRYEEHAICWYDSVTFTNPTDPKADDHNGALKSIRKSEEHEISCSDSEDTFKVTGFVHYYVQGSLSQTLTATAPTSTQTAVPAFTATPTSGLVIKDVSFGPVRIVGTDGAEKNFSSVAFIEKSRIVVLSSSAELTHFSGDDMSKKRKPDFAFKWCYAETATYSGMMISPCYGFVSTVAGVSFTTPGLIAPELFYGAETDGTMWYTPFAKPRPTATHSPSPTATP